MPSSLQVRNELRTHLLRIQEQTVMESLSPSLNISGCHLGPGLGEQVGSQRALTWVATLP